MKSSPRYCCIFRALAGDSTTTRPPCCEPAASDAAIAASAAGAAAAADMARGLIGCHRQLAAGRCDLWDSCGGTRHLAGPRLALAKLLSAKAHTAGGVCRSSGDAKAALAGAIAVAVPPLKACRSSIAVDLTHCTLV